MKPSPQTSGRHPRAGLPRRLAAAFALALLVTLAGGTATASAAKPAAAKAPGWPKPWAVRFVSPNNHAVVTDGTVRITAQLAPGVRAFRALVDDSNVTGWFQAAAGGHVREATLKVGKTPGLGYGRHVIYVETRGKAGQTWWAQRRILVARPATGLLAGASAHRVKGAGVKVRVTAAKPYFHASLRIDGGRRIEIPGNGRRHQLHLSADQGLHPGPNLIAVRALDGKNGRYEIRRIPIVLPRDVPVAGAGGPHRASRGQAVRFDGSSTNVADGVRAHYRWTIENAPSGSKAKLRKATSPHPILRPDRIGRYVLKLTVTGQDAAASARPAGGNAAIASSVEEPTEASSDSAMTTLDATPAHGAIGVPIDTIAEEGIKVGEQSYAMPHIEDGLQMLVLSRSTLHEVSNTSYPISEAGTDELYEAIHGLNDDDEDLVIVTKPDAADEVDNENVSADHINEALEEIGVGPIPETVAAGKADCQEAVPCSAFSAIGIPGLPIGQGDVNAGLGRLAGHASGDLHGYLQEELTGRHPFTYISTERAPFDTGAESENPATVTIGSSEAGSPLAEKKYTSGKIEGGGWFVVLLNAGNLEKISENTYPDTASGLEQMHAELSKYEGSGTTLAIVRSVGKVSRVDSPAWDEVATDLQAYGGSSLYVNTLGSAESNETYAQVGPSGTPGYPSPWTQVATPVRSGTGRLTGLLGYDRKGQLYPAESVPATGEDLAHPLEGTLPGLISLPASAWPEEKWSAPEEAAEKCIASLVDPLGSLSTPIHLNYTDANSHGDWGTYASKLEGIALKTIQGIKSCESVTEPQYETVRKQLLDEWSAIPSVYALYENLELALKKVDGADQAESVAEAVSQSIAIPSPTTAKVSFNWSGIASDSLWVVSSFFPEDALVSSTLNYFAGALGLAGELDRGPEGSQEHVSVSASKFAETLSTQLDHAASNLGRDREIILGDWNKLQIAARNAKHLEGAPANWSWDESVAEEAVDAMMVSIRRQSYETLFPAAYSLFRLQAGTSTLPTNPARYKCVLEGGEGTKYEWEPFKGIQQYGSVDVPVDGSGTIEDWVYGEPDTTFASHAEIYVQTPSAALLKDIFGQPAATDPYQREPLFNGEEFAIETYANGTADTISVTHVAPGKLSIIKKPEICQAS